LNIKPILIAEEVDFIDNLDLMNFNKNNVLSYSKRYIAAPSNVENYSVNKILYNLVNMPTEIESTVKSQNFVRGTYNKLKFYYK
jgi:hypothetical protein